MNRDAFVAFRDDVTSQRNLLRLDCMNPFVAMGFLKKRFSSALTDSADTVLDLWAERMDMHGYRHQALASPGVRQSLLELFNLFAAQGKEVWLPEDIYPFYWDAARGAGVKIRSFPTLPAPDFSMLDQADVDSVVLITNPISPLGRMMNAHETGILQNWLAASRDRRLILDTVYAYTCGFDNYTRDLLGTGQCLVAHSLSKAWLQRGVFGVLIVPDNDFNACRTVVRPPPQRECGDAFRALEQHADMPYEQQAAFTAEWRRLLPAIQKFAPDFQVPQTGYFAAITVPYEKVLSECDALVIPGSVFGSTRNDVSVISCLHAMGP